MPLPMQDILYLICSEVESKGLEILGGGWHVVHLNFRQIGGPEFTSRHRPVIVCVTVL